MGIYKKAYERYRNACENYGIESLTINQFIHHLTFEQLHEYTKHIIN